MLRKTITSIASASLLAAPAGNAWAATHVARVAPRATTITTTVNGPSIKCKRWGQIVVAVKLKKTTKIVGARTTVTLKILDVKWPTWPQTTFRSVYINTQALPLLREEVLEIQSADVEVISGATDVTTAFKTSLQAALLEAKKPT